MKTEEPKWMVFVRKVTEIYSNQNLNTDIDVFSDPVQDLQLAAVHLKQVRTQFILFIALFSPLITLIKNFFLQKNHTISNADVDIYKYVSE